MSSMDEKEKLSVALVLRIVGNLIAFESTTEFSLKEFIQLLTLQNETFSNIINTVVNIDSVYGKELLWIAGNIYRTNDDFVLEYLNCSDDIVNTLIMLNSK